MPFVPSSFWNPAIRALMLPLVVWWSLLTLMPQPSSHTLMARGTCSTPAAFMASQKGPSLVLASPMVPKATSLPRSLRCA